MFSYFIKESRGALECRIRSTFPKSIELWKQAPQSSVEIWQGGWLGWYYKYMNAEQTSYNINGYIGFNMVTDIIIYQLHTLIFSPRDFVKYNLSYSWMAIFTNV